MGANQALLRILWDYAIDSQLLPDGSILVCVFGLLNVRPLLLLFMHLREGLDLDRQWGGEEIWSDFDSIVVVRDKAQLRDTLKVVTSVSMSYYVIEVRCFAINE